ncbi:MAG: hypothetical protein MUO33_10020 [Sedimentisphaerales bacterium]|nr:hypothetical protein [Sedimentisphaerales bacterium]
MNDKNIEEILKKVAAENIPADVHKIAQQVSADFSRTLLQTKKQHILWEHIIRSSITKLAAAAVIVIAVFLGMYFVGNPFGSNVTFAQVVESMKKARTIHAVGYAPQDGRMQKANEIWYERGVGIKFAWTHEKEWRVVIDNGQWLWKYRQGDHFAERNKSLGIDNLPREITEPSRYLDKCVRDSAGDMVVDGVLCELYVGSYPNKPDSTRLMYWIDQERRPRRFEEKVLEKGIWKTIELGQVAYDIAFDRSVFDPNFGQDVDIVNGPDFDSDLGAGVEIADGAKILGAHFSLEKAIFTKEEMGLIFAVHELRRCQDDLIFALTSLRPSEQTLKDIKSEDPRAHNYGDYHFGSCWERTDGRDTSFSPIELGWIYHGGLVVKWTVFVPNGFEAGQVTQCKFDLDSLFTEGKLAMKRTETGLPVRERLKPIATLPLPDEQVSLENLVGGVYDVVELFEPIVAEESLTLKPIPFTDEEMEDFTKRVPSDGITTEWKAGNKSVRLWHGQSKKPSQINKDTWAEDRLTYIQEKQRQKQL